MRSLYSFVSAATLVVGLTGIAAAADLPVKYRPPVAEPTWSWTGLYFGAHVGGAFGTIESETTGIVFPVASATINGFAGGGQIGYNWQTGPIVLGIEADVSGTNLEGNTPCLVVLSCNRKVDYFGTVAGRVGFTADRALLYVKGGGAFADFKYNTSAFGATIATADDTKWGWMVGTGIEYALWQNFSAKIEYDFMDFGKDAVAFNVVGGGPALNINTQQYIHTVKFGLNYRFGAPLMARY